MTNLAQPKRKNKMSMGELTAAQNALASVGRAFPVELVRAVLFAAEDLMHDQLGALGVPPAVIALVDDVLLLRDLEHRMDDGQELTDLQAISLADLVPTASSRVVELGGAFELEN